MHAHWGVRTRGMYAEVACVPGGHTCWGHACPGACMPRFACMPGGHACHACCPVDRMTDMSKNISFPQTSFAGGNQACLMVCTLSKLISDNNTSVVLKVWI